ncbi:beta-ketoadipate enol-lactone hydrolase, partial [Pseudohyphozyma bogoriensis]
MPFLELVEHQIRMYYVINCLQYTEDPTIHILNPSKPNLVLLHFAGSSVEFLSGQDMARFVNTAIEKLGIESYSIVGENYLGANVGSWLTIWNPSK